MDIAMEERRQTHQAAGATAVTQSCGAIARVILLLTFCVLGGACKSAQARREEPTSLQPLHVVLVPEVPTAIHRRAGPLEESSNQLEIDGLRMMRILGRKLAQNCYQKVTLLPLPPTSARAQSWSREQRDAWWIQHAQDAGADLLLECALKRDASVKRERNGSFWLNLPLFFLGGPMCYFVGDQSYDVRVELTAQVYDLTTLVSTGGELKTQRTKLATFQSRFAGADLDFAQRASGDAGAYWTSLIIPASFLSLDSPNAYSALQEVATEELVQRMTESIRRRGVLAPNATAQIKLPQQ